jgi:hypothetical protein
MRLTQRIPRFIDHLEEDKRVIDGTFEEIMMTPWVQSYKDLSSNGEFVRWGLDRRDLVAFYKQLDGEVRWWTVGHFDTEPDPAAIAVFN